MTDVNRIQHNARIIRRIVKGKPKNDRVVIYRQLCVGPLLWPVYVIMNIEGLSK